MGDEPAFIDIKFMKDFNQRRSALATGSIKPGYTRDENALNEDTTSYEYRV